MVIVIANFNVRAYRKTNASHFGYGHHYSLKRNLRKIHVQLFLILVMMLLCYSVSSMPDMAKAATVSQDMIKTSGLNATNTSSTTLTSIVANCPGLIDVDPGSTAYNTSNIECVQKLFNNCSSSSFLLLYGLGSLNVSIKGKNGDSTSCLIDLSREIEMGNSNPYSCSVPTEKIANWRSWRNANGLEALDDILPFCSRNNI